MSGRNAPRIRGGSSSTQPSENGANNVKAKGKRGTQAKGVQAQAIGTKESWKCEICEKEFNKDDDKMMECDRCSCYYCIACLGMSSENYMFLSQSVEVSWFCKECKAPALKAVREDREIEERCKEYFAKIETKFSELEEKVELKADKSVVDSLDTKIKSLKEDQLGTATDIGKIFEELSLLRNEPDEKRKRKNNVVIYGIPETERENDIANDDIEKVNEILEAIDIDVNPLKYD